MEDDEIVVACTSVILASIGAAVEVSEAEKKKRKHKTCNIDYDIFACRDIYISFIFLCQPCSHVSRKILGYKML